MRADTVIKMADPLCETAACSRIEMTTCIELPASWRPVPWNLLYSSGCSTLGTTLFLSCLKVQSHLHCDTIMLMEKLYFFPPKAAVWRERKKDRQGWGIAVHLSAYLHLAESKHHKAALFLKVRYKYPENLWKWNSAGRAASSFRCTVDW